MKAYWVQVKGDDCGMFVHAESRSQAKKLFLKEYPFTGQPEWIDLRVQRQSGLDDLPFTDDAVKINDGVDPNRDIDEVAGAYLEFCRCSMCEAEKAKSKTMHVLTDLGMTGQSVELVLVPVAVETEE